MSPVHNNGDILLFDSVPRRACEHVAGKKESRIWEAGPHGLTIAGVLGVAFGRVALRRITWPDVSPNQLARCLFTRRLGAARRPDRHGGRARYGWPRRAGE
jgi:hypothetical protein